MDKVFSDVIDNIDLMPIHFYACIIGAVLSLLVMQMLSSGVIVILHECRISFWCRRLSLTICGASMCWSALSGQVWQPFPADLAIIIGLDLMLLAGLIVAWRKHQANMTPPTSNWHLPIWMR